MEIGILAALLGLGLVFGMGGGSDEDDADEALDPAQEPEVEEPQTEEPPAVVGSLVQGTDGADTIGSEPFNATEVFTLLGGDGDDNITYDTFVEEGVREPQGYAIIEGGRGNDLIDLVNNSNVSSEVSGGEGNDIIIGNAFAVIHGDEGDDLIVLDDDAEQLEATAFGGDGNDTIYGLQDNSVYGEDGDDTFIITHASLWNGTGFASGGAGDDNFTIIGNLGTPYLVQEGLLIEGNEGSDTFTLDLDVSVDPAWEEFDGGSNGTGIIIRDFNPEEDTLTIQINQNGSELGERPLTAVTIVNDEIVLEFQGQGDQTPFSTTIGLQNAEGISVDDLTIQYVDLAGNVSSVWEPDSNAGEVLTLPEDGSGIIGTDGNDTLSVAFSEAYTEDYLPRFFGAIKLGDGDDLADVEIFGPNIDGGLGNDTITSFGIDGRILGGDGDDLIATYGLNYIEGGDGNDTISGAEAEQIFGGAGDDVLSASADAIYDGNGVLDGGTGDDTITAYSAIGHWRSDFPSVDVIGGDGADVVDLQLYMSDGYSQDTSPQSPTSTTTAISLSDFDADEDSLLIQINRAEGNEDREMISAEIISTESEYQGQLSTRTDIVMRFAGTETSGAHTATVRLGADVNLTIDDIVFVQN